MKRLLIFTVSILFISFSYGQTQAEINQEAYEEYQKSDNELNLVYSKILKEYKDDTAFIKNLKIAQRLWIQFRDAEVNAKYPEGGQEYYGSMYNMCLYIYMKELTDDRIKKLKIWSTGIEEDEACSGSVKTKKELFTNKSKPLDIENALKYIAENLDYATFLPIRDGWQHDYGFKNGGLLNKFEYIRSLLTYKDFQALLDYPIYLSGPHTRDKLNLNSNYSFGHYNPKFVMHLRKSALSILSNKAFTNNTKPLLEKYGLLEFLAKHKEIYEITQNNPDDFTQIKSDFLKGIKDKTWEDGEYSEMIPEQMLSEYYWYWGPTSYHFWVRRDIDNTIDLWAGLLSDVLNAYDS